MLAVHLENLLFLLLLVVAGLFQLLGKTARKTSTDETRRSSKPASRPPPPVAQRPTYPKPLVLPRVPTLGSPLPPLVTRPRDMPQEIQIPPSVASVPVQPKQ